MLLFNYWKGLVLRSVQTYFLEVRAYMSLKRTTAGLWEGLLCCVWLKILLLSNTKTEEWDLKVVMFNYWNGLVLGSVESSFLEVGTYVSLKRATTGLWEVRFCCIWLKLSLFLNIKADEWDLIALLFNYWNGLALSSVETCFLEVGAYVSLKLTTTGLEEGRFSWIWQKISLVFQYKNGGVGARYFTV